MPPWKYVYRPKSGLKIVNPAATVYLCYFLSSFLSVYFYRCASVCISLCVCSFLLPPSCLRVSLLFLVLPGAVRFQSEDVKEVIGWSQDDADVFEVSSFVTQQPRDKRKPK